MCVLIFGVTKFYVFPNPNNGWFTIKYNGSANHKAVYIKITDALGKIVFQKEQDNFNNEMQLDISNQVPGIYTLKIASDNVPSFMSRISLEK
jgi:Secretion system C-terminal sorting domain